MSKEQPTEFPAQDERDLEEYGVWVKSGPEDIDEGPEGSPDSAIEDLATSPAGDELALTDEEEELLAELDDIPSWDTDRPGGSEESSEGDLPDSDLGEEIDLDFDLDIDDSTEGTGAEEPTFDDFDLSDDSVSQSDSLEQIGDEADIDLERISLPDDEPFDEFEFTDSDEEDERHREDIPELALETEETAEPAGSEQQPPDGAPDSTQLAAVLQSVQAELGEIKREISDIRSQVAELRSAAVLPESQDSSRPSLEQELAEGGFFEEGADEDDETIALTGDELDNILNTAEFVEEPVHDETVHDEALPEEAFAEQEPLGADLLGEQLGEDSEESAAEDAPTERVLEQDALEQPEAELEQTSEADELSEPLDALNQGFDGELTIDDLGFEPLDHESEQETHDTHDEQQPAPQELGGQPDEQPDEEGLLPPDIDVIPVDLGDKPSSSDEHEHEALLDEDLPLDALQEAPGEAHTAETETPDIETEEQPASELEQETQDSGFDFTLDDISFEDESLADEAEGFEQLEVEPAEEPTTELSTEEAEPTSDDLELDELSLDELDLEEPELGEPELDEIAPEHVETSEEAEAAPAEDLARDASEPTETTEEDYLGGDDGLDALADMDIDSELAGIEELSDAPSDEDFALSTDELEGIRFDIEDEPEASEPEQAGDGADQAADQATEEPAQESLHDRSDEIPGDLREEIRSVLHYMDQLLEALPEDKIQEFAESEHFEVYKRLFEELGLEQ